MPVGLAPGPLGRILRRAGHLCRRGDQSISDCRASMLPPPHGPSPTAPSQAGRCLKPRSPPRGSRSKGSREPILTVFHLREPPHRFTWVWVTGDRHPTIPPGGIQPPQCCRFPPLLVPYRTARDRETVGGGIRQPAASLVAGGLGGGRPASSASPSPRPSLHGGQRLPNPGDGGQTIA